MKVLLLTLLLNIMSIQMAPISTMQQPLQPQMLLQQQLSALQQLQAMQSMTPENFPMSMMARQPIQIIILPNESIDDKQSNLFTKHRDTTKEDVISIEGETDENLDSVVVEAKPKVSPPRAIVLVPGGRLSIGDIIQAIPFLPIEINVPDTLSWAFNGITGWISGLGQFFRPSYSSNIISEPQIADPNMPMQVNSIKSLLRRLQANRNGLSPIVVVPVAG